MANMTILPPAAPPMPTIAHTSEAASIWMAQVFAPIAQNVAGGIGAAVLAAIGGFLLEGQRLTAGVAQWAAIIGLTLFGAAMLVRMFRDEWRILVSAWGSRQDLAARAELAALVEDLENANAQLRAEGTVAERWVAREAAEALVTAYYANTDVDAQPLARAASLQRGMTRADWEAGTHLLKAAGLLERGTIRATTPAEALAAIARHCQTARRWTRTGNGDLTPG
jgi:hypothetical protein